MSHDSKRHQLIQCSMRSSQTANVMIIYFVYNVIFAIFMVKDTFCQCNIWWLFWKFSIC